MIQKLDTIRIEASNALDQKKRSELGQFMTPVRIAQFMASLFSKIDQPVHLLEAGAGIGSLAGAFLERLLENNRHSSASITAYEIDPGLSQYLANNLRAYERVFFDRGKSLSTKILTDDFILSTRPNSEPNFTHAILNPPYKKINSLSDHRLHLRSLGQEHVNLYSAFVGLALSLLHSKGELVAILPRSFCNGVYYKPFREYVLNHAAIKSIHLFESRTDAFKDDEVLQENIIIHLKKNSRQGDVVLSTSRNSGLDNLTTKRVPFSSIVKRNNPELFIHIPQRESSTFIHDKINFTLKEIGLQVSTGPVVDFRVKKYLRMNSSQGSMPLLYAIHFDGRGISWPKVTKKPNALIINKETIRSAIPNGFYTVVKRFSSKEEKQRIVARVIEPTLFSTKLIGLENHLNFFHFDKHGINKDLAYGLAAYLNTSFVDNVFRSFNGHTQVNATDLRQLKYPSREALISIGKWAKKIKNFTPENLDAKVMQSL